MKNTEQLNLRLPEHFSEYYGDSIMSNFDRKISREIANAIKHRHLYGEYTGWNFYGKVWWKNRKWCCEVWCYGSYIETFVCDTLEEIMDEVSSKYGYD